MPLCNATRSNGLPCAAQAVHDGDKCSFHKGQRHVEPLKLTPELADKLISLLKAGNYVAVAVRAAGISRALFYKWLDRGASDAPEDAAYAELRERVERAKAEGEARNVAQIASAARENWQAAAWMLERMYPDRWGRGSVRLRDVPDEEAPQVERSADPDDPFAEVDQLAEMRARRRDAS
jgi:hypothetical protein